MCVGRNFSFSFFLSAQGWKSDFSEEKRGSSGTSPDIRLNDAGIQFGYVEQRAEQILHRLERPLHLPDQHPSFVAVCSSASAEIDEMGCIERLQHVMACCSKETRFRQVSLLGRFLGLDEFDVGLFKVPSVARNSSVRMRTLLSRLIAVWKSEKALPCWSMERSTRETSASLIRFSFSRSLICRKGIRWLYSSVRRPKAMPVNVWFRCMDLYCSP